MSSTPSRAGMARYLIRSRDDDTAPLAAFLDSFGQDPELAVVDLIGPPGRPHTAVVEMSRGRAHALVQDLGEANSLIIEPDRPLSLFQDGELE